jgi:hypothetical protein
MFLGKKCPLCKERLRKGEVFSALELKALDGNITVNICPRCADFWDNTATVLEKHKQEQDMEAQLPDEVNEDE